MDDQKKDWEIVMLSGDCIQFRADRIAITKDGALLGTNMPPSGAELAIAFPPGQWQHVSEVGVVSGITKRGAPKQRVRGTVPP